VLGLGVIASGTWYWDARDAAQSRDQFAAASQDVAAQAQQNLLRYGDLLAASRALFTQGVVTRPQYNEFVRSVGFGTPRLAAIQGIGFVQRVPHAQLKHFLASLGRAGIHVRSVLPDGKRPSYCLASYVEVAPSPPAPRLDLPVPLFGYDFCTIPSIAAVLQRAATDRTQQVVSGFTFPSALSRFRSVLIFVQPVDAPGTHRTLGWAIAMVDEPAAVAAVGTGTGVEYAVYSDSAGRSQPVLSSPWSAVADPAWSLRRPITAYGHWTVATRPAPYFASGGAGLTGPVAFLLLGLLANALLVALLASLAGGRRRALRTVEEATASLRTSEERFRSLAAAAPIGIAEATDGYLTYANTALASICGRGVDVLLGHGWLEAVHEEDRPGLVALIEDAHVARTRHARAFRVLRPDGSVRHVQMLAAPKGERPGAGYVVSISDVTDEMVARQALAHHELHDTLTGLPNRALFLRRLGEEIDRAAGDPPRCAVLLLDLDRFKLVNDSLGHETGDRVLRSLSDRLMGTLRAGDTMARLGGDEFIFLLLGVPSVKPATQYARRLLAALSAPIRFDGSDLTLTASIGVVVTQAGVDPATVLRDADTAMYQAKAAGRNRYAVFEDDLHVRSVTRLSMEAELRRALAEDELQVHFQPIVQPDTSRPLGAEALVRWRHPDRDLVSPAEFLPVAEDAGLMGAVGRRVLEMAVAHLARWDAVGDLPHVPVLNVNMSASQLEEPSTLQMVRAILAAHHVAPTRLCIEVTESAVMAEQSRARHVLEGLRDLGLKTAVDDFGTGYSSLARLHTLPVNAIKVDISFVRRLGSRDDSTAVVKAIVELSHALGCTVVAEGVEDEATRARVAALGCEAAQGWHWAPALAADDFVRWWRAAVGVETIPRGWVEAGVDG
jgi:diguanylate cyclase (GGDEF)-like protein/PAS domain S-box-containing protein